MQVQLTALGALDAEGRATGTAERTAVLYARYMKEGGDTRYIDELTAEGHKKIAALQEKGCDLGYGFMVRRLSTCRMEKMGWCSNHMMIRKFMPRL